jgi:hypothetical protein
LPGIGFWWFGMSIIAYVDPGLGLLAWQAVVAFFLGLFFYVRRSRTWLLRLVQKIFRNGNNSKINPPVSRLPSDVMRQ